MKEDVSPFFALVFRQKYIRRWGLMRNTFHETLAEHSSECAILAHALATIGNVVFGKNYDTGRVVTLALYHDVPEVFTGDMPTPVKYANPVIRSQFGLIEEQTAASLLGRLPEELRAEFAPMFSDLPEDAELHKVVKAADNLCAYIKCAEEEKAHNSEFSSAKAGIEKKLKATELPELDYFMEHFLPAFTLTLDEQQSL